MYYGIEFERYEQLRKNRIIYQMVHRKQDKDKIKRNITF